MTPDEIDLAINELETRLERLRALYEQYFMGIERMEPSVVRKDVDRRFYVLRKEKIRNTAKRFKLQTLVQRYNTMQQYWSRICREIELGTYKRHKLKAERTFASMDARAEAAAEAAQALDAGADESAASDSSAPADTASARAARASRAAEDDLADLLSSGGFDAGDELDAAMDALFSPAKPAPQEPTAAPEKRGGLLSQLGAARPASSPQPSSAQPSSTQPASSKPTSAQPSSAQPVSSQASSSLPTSSKPISSTLPTSSKPVSTLPSGAQAPASSVPRPSAPISGAPPTASKAPPVPRPSVPTPSAAPPRSGPPLPPPRPSAAPRSGPPAPPPRPSLRPPTSRPPLPPPRSLPAPAPERPAAAPAAPAPARPAALAQPRPAVAAQPKPAASSGLDDARLRELHQRYQAAREQTKAAPVSLEKLAQNLRETEAKLRAQHQGRRVDFDVVVKDGKAVIKPKLT